MSEESITLEPRKHGKIGAYHCGVTRDGFVSIAGEVHNIDDGQEVKASRAPITVTRKGTEYRFLKRD
ncbi:MAG: hypothetical protein PVG98_15515 [Chromatiales bacterium]|jgi:hypothetical protein